MGNLSNPVAYAILGAIAAAFLGGKRRKGKSSRVVKGAALGALAAYGAPRLGIALPRLGAG